MSSTQRSIWLMGLDVFEFQCGLNAVPKGEVIEAAGVEVETELGM